MEQRSFYIFFFKKRKKNLTQKCYFPPPPSFFNEKIGDIHPILRKLQALHNFTIESQVQYFAPLAFEPSRLDTEQSYVLTREQLSVFINSEEWTLGSFLACKCDFIIFGYNFVLFFPFFSGLDLMRFPYSVGCI